MTAAVLRVEEKELALQHQVFFLLKLNSLFRHVSKVEHDLWLIWDDPPFFVLMEALEQMKPHEEKQVPQNFDVVRDCPLHSHDERKAFVWMPVSSDWEAGDCQGICWSRASHHGVIMDDHQTFLIQKHLNHSHTILQFITVKSQ